MTSARISVGSSTPSARARMRLTSPSEDARAGVLIDAERYAELIERLDYLEDSLAALKARDERDATTSWSELHT
jgi:hypothetical protein